MAWTDLALSTLAVAVAAGLSYLLGERASQRAFRRKKLYALKLETYLEILNGFDKVLSGIEASTDSTWKAIEPMLRVELGVQAAPAAMIDGVVAEIKAVMLPVFRRMDWEALGVTDAQLRAAREATLRPVPSPANPYRMELLESMRDYLPFTVAFSEARRQLDRAYSKLVLLGIPRDLAGALRSFLRRLNSTTFEKGFAIYRMEGKELEKTFTSLRERWEQIAEEMRTDLISTMG